MPCSCQLPLEEYPDASEWGPILWSILHGIAERSGTVAYAPFRDDERRALTNFMKSVAKMIPCPSCKEHYEVYLKEHPIEKELKEMPYEHINGFVKAWFWELHNWVNESYKKPVFPYTSLHSTYRATDIRGQMRAFDDPMKRAIRLRSGQFFGYNDFIKYLKILLSLYGL